MPDSLQWIQDTPVWNTGYNNRLDSQRTKNCKPSTDMMVHSRHTRTSNSWTPIMCQTWHSGTQLWQSTSRRRSWCSRRNPQQRSSRHKTSHPSTQVKTSLRHIWDRFKGIGHFPGTYYITLHSDAKTHCTCTTEVPDCYVATGVRKTRWVHGTRNHHPSGGAHRLGILTCLLLESKWQAESLFGSPRCQQTHWKRPLQGTYCWRDNTSMGQEARSLTRSMEPHHTFA